MLENQRKEWVEENGEGVNVLGRERREVDIGLGGTAETSGKGSKSSQRAKRRHVEREGREGGQEGGGGDVKGWKNVGILQQSGWCEGGRVRNVAGNARASSVCKNHTATFLILDITDKLFTHTQCAFKVQACNIQIVHTAAPSQIRPLSVLSS